MRDKTEIILGPPGTGKTHALLDIVNELLADGVDPARIAYLAFTQRAAKEARKRAQERFLFKDKDMPWFVTIHAMAFRQIGARRQSVMHGADYSAVAKSVNLSYNGAQVEQKEELKTAAPANALFFLDNLIRISGQSFAELYGERLKSYMRDDFIVESLAKLQSALVNYKEANGKRDFSDILQEFVEAGVPPSVDYVIVDEAQDLSRLQWRVVEKVAAKARRVIVAGDDDQAIYRWAGADVDNFISLPGEKKVLHQSYRVPRAGWALANKLLARIKHRNIKEYLPRDAEGSVRFVVDDADLDASKGDWLFLCRHGFQFRELKRLCHYRGWMYVEGFDASNRTEEAEAIIAWTNLQRGKEIIRKQAATAMKFAGQMGLAEEFLNNSPSSGIDKTEIPLDFTRDWIKALSISAFSKDYFRNARRAGEPMAKVDQETGILTPAPPRIRISTIHGAKGAEADGVYLLSDVSESTLIASHARDDETRVFFVAVTRFREQLVIKEPDTMLFYDFPR